MKPLKMDAIRAGRADKEALLQLRILVQSEPYAGAQFAKDCQYDAQKLALRCGCTLRRLEQVFKNGFRSPNEWLREQRLIRALEELSRLQSEGKLESVKRFALEAGYSNPDHFRRAFKAVFGLCPQAFLEARKTALRQLGISLPPGPTSLRP